MERYGRLPPASILRKQKEVFSIEPRALHIEELKIGSGKARDEANLDIRLTPQRSLLEGAQLPDYCSAIGSRRTDEPESDAPVKVVIEYGPLAMSFVRL
jgi:hypothetical protein